jgi:hypothetical protein
MGLLHFVGSRKKRVAKSALANTEICPAKISPRASDFSSTSIIFAWMELGNGSFWGDALGRSWKRFGRQSFKSITICGFGNALRDRLYDAQESTVLPQRT